MNNVIFFKEILHREYIKACTRMNYKIVPVTNLNKYVHSVTTGTE